MRGDFARAVALGEATIARLRETGDEFWLRLALGDFGLYLAMSGEPERGAASIEEALAVDREHGDRYMAGVRLSDLGVLFHDRGDTAEAARCYAESARLLWEAGGAWYMASPVAGLAAIIAPRNPPAAARLIGAADALRERSGTPGWATEQARDEQAIAIARAALGEDACAQECATGRSMPLADVVEEAQAVISIGATKPRSTEPRAGSTAAPARLSTRELEVLRLVASGRSDREIAETLYISPRTASKHVANILAKLGVASRAEAAAVAVRTGLV
jgi:DNA-binding CsgD family transcriptional regulator